MNHHISYIAVVEYEHVTVYSTVRKTFPVLNEKVTHELKFTCSSHLAKFTNIRTLQIKPAVQYLAVFPTSNLAKICRLLTSSMLSTAKLKGFKTSLESNNILSTFKVFLTNIDVTPSKNQALCEYRTLVIS